MFAINKICRDEEGMMEMMNSCSAIIFLKYLVLNLISPKDWIHYYDLLFIMFLVLLNSGDLFYEN